VDDRRELERGSASREEGNTPEERSLDELAKGVAEGTISRSKALKAGGAAFLGGMLSVFALPSRDADAARRRLLKTLWAVVTINADHTITVNRSKGVTASSRLGTGQYRITFNRDVSRCVYSATIESTSGGGEISAFGGPLQGVVTEREVLVSTYDNSGSFDDEPFHLVVNC
jgi:hypothetical protein